MSKSTAIKVLIHTDGCDKLIINGKCSKCGFAPSMQDTCFAFYCPKDNIKLNKDGKCRKCKKYFLKTVVQKPNDPMLVMLRHTAPNDLYVEAIELTQKMTRRLKVDLKNMTFQRSGDNFFYRIGKDMALSGRCPHGMIGIFDISNIDHINAMLNSAYQRSY